MTRALLLSFSPHGKAAQTFRLARALLDGTDAVMLSQETAIGAHPIGAIAMMAAIAMA